MNDAEWIGYLEESIRELRKEKENLKKEKWELRQRLLKLEEAQAELSRVKENKELREENKKLKEERIFSLWEWDYMILTSTTPQLKLTKKDNSDLYSNITIWTTKK